MKRLLSLLLVMVIVVAFAGCGLEKKIESQSADKGSTAVGEEANADESNENSASPEDDEADNSANNGDEKFISKAEAKQIALLDAGLAENEIIDYEIEVDRESTGYYYELSFEAGGFEYEYDIEAASGKIARKYKEKED